MTVPTHVWTHKPAGTDPLPAIYEIKVFSDTSTLSTGNGAFIFAIPKDVGGTKLQHAAAFVTTVGSSLSRVQIRNVTQAVDMLSTRVTIDSSEFTSYTSGTPPVIDPTNRRVAVGDLVAIDVDNAGSGAKGLGVILQFSA